MDQLPARLGSLHATWLWRRPTVAVLLACGLVPGCGPRRQLDAPPQWPARWRGLTLYHTPEALIYARDASLAGEADRLIRRVARDFKYYSARQKAGSGHAQGPGPGKGLVLFPDRVEDLPIRDPLRHYATGMRSTAGGQQLDEDTLARNWELIAAALSDNGIDPAAELVVRSLVLDRQALIELNVVDPAWVEPIPWALEMPSRTLIEGATRELLNAKVEHRGVGPLEVMATAPLLVVEESRMVNSAAVNRDVVLFSQWVGAAGWEERASQELLQQYTQRKVDEAIFPVLTALRDTVVEVAEPVVQPLVPRSGE